MLLITDRDIICLTVFISKTVKREEDRTLLLETLATGKPVIAKALLLVLAGADFGFIQTYTRMPEGYFQRFLDNFYEFHGKYPRLVFLFPNLRENIEVMRQVYFTAGLRKDYEFLKEAERVLGVYEKLSKVAGKLIVPPVPVEKSKSTEGSEKSDKSDKRPTEYLEKLEELARLDKVAEEFLSNYDYTEKVKFIEAMSKDPSSFIESVFGKRGFNGKKSDEDVSEDKKP